MTPAQRARRIHRLRAQLARLELEQSREVPTFSEYLRERVGRNWVITRRTARIVLRHGDDVVYLSPARYKTLRELYEAKTGLSPDYYPPR